MLVLGSSTSIGCRKHSKSLFMSSFEFVHKVQPLVLLRSNKGFCVVPGIGHCAHNLNIGDSEIDLHDPLNLSDAPHSSQA